MRSATQKSRIAKAAERVFVDAGARIVNREVADIRRVLKKLFERDQQDFVAWLEDFYRSAPEWITKIISPVAITLSDSIRIAINDELGTDGDMTPEMQVFVKKYINNFATAHSNRGKNQIEKLIAEAEGTENNPIDLIEERLKNWEEKTPGKIGMRETVQLTSAVSYFLYKSSGVTKLRWVNTGSKTCPFCEQLNGRVVGIDQMFIPANSELVADDGSGMKISGPKMHAPIHEGCQCQIVVSN